VKLTRSLKRIANWWLLLIVCCFGLTTNGFQVQADDFPPDELLRYETGLNRPPMSVSADQYHRGLDLELGCLANRPLCQRLRMRCDAWFDEAQLLPGEILYPAYLASPFQARLGSQIHGVVGDGGKWDSTLGGRVGWFRTTSLDGETTRQFDFEGSCVVRTDPQERLDVDFTDFRISLPYTIAQGSHRFKIGVEHLCSHLGDEYLLKHGLTTRDNYSRDALVLGYGNYLDLQTRIYGEMSYGWRTNVSRPWHFQFGMDRAPAYHTGRQGAPFWAVNGLLRQETRFGGTLNFQTGWAWRNAEIGRLLRTGIFLQTGKATNLSYHNTSETQLGMGLWYDF
jgi:hypothetical protein